MAETAGQIAEYFGDTADEVRVTQVFYGGGEGWVAKQAPASMAALRMLRAQGGVAVAVSDGRRVADFQLDPIFKFGERPVFGGRVI